MEENLTKEKNKTKRKIKANIACKRVAKQSTQQL
jgi:ribosomal protein L28